MSQSVDPFVIPLPKKFMVDPEIRNYFEYLNRWCHDIWKRTGGGFDSIDSLSSSVESIDGTADSLQALIDALTVDLTTLTNDFNTSQIKTIKITNVDLTSAGTETIICTSPVTITLRATPENAEQVTVKTVSPPVTINGGGLNIDGAATYQSLANYESRTFIYSSARGEWLII